MKESATLWQFWIDVGGTFTDCLGQSPEGNIVRHKILSSGIVKGHCAAGSDRSQIVDPGRSRDPDDFWLGWTFRLIDQAGGVIAERQITGYSIQPAGGHLLLDSPLSDRPWAGQNYELRSHDEAPIVALRYLLRLPAGRPLPPVQVRLGTTRGTNALLTRQGARTAWVTTRGFGDLLQIGYQNRPKLFELAIHKSAPLFETAVEIDERLAADGAVLLAPRAEQIKEVLGPLRDSGIESLAIGLLHAYLNPAHELLVGQIARDLGFTEISLSHAVAPLIKLVARGDTTVADAYLNPVLRQYVAGLQEQLGPQSELRLMTSAGGLVRAEHFTGKDSILSGPAGGVVGFSRVAERAGFARSIGFDMGGTSTDVARYDGRYELEYETTKAGVRMVVPTLSIETVAAGGGSICRFDGVKLVVGPASAGADPGPACYGRGGPLAVTDLNFYLGRILPEHFPFPLDRQAVESRLRQLVDEVAAATGKHYSLPELCTGLLRVANANMVKAIRTISIAKGYDPADYVLVAFGGAAGQHACAVAAELGMKKILHHPDAGLLSAYGMGLANVVRHRATGIYQPYTAEILPSLAETFSRLESETAAELAAEGAPSSQISLRRSLDLRYQGADAFLNVAAPQDGDYPKAFAAAHRQLYGYEYAQRAVEIVAARVEASGTNSVSEPATKEQPFSRGIAAGSTIAWFENQPCETSIYTRDRLVAGAEFSGPAIVQEASSTVVIDPGWHCQVLAGGELLVTPHQAANRSAESANIAAPNTALGSAAPDPVQLEIFNNQFAAIAEQMGVTLRNTASSVNVKERLDFSCALFTATGQLVVNAPHIPVHLGAMGETVRQVLAENPRLQPGDVFVTNDPYGGGSHLPDVTVVTPVHHQGELVFVTASRAHHAEIGGISPGSMPPFSRHLAEEGVLIRNFPLVAAGQARFDALEHLLRSGPFPSRAAPDNLADIAAQVAANQQGARDLQNLIAREGQATVLEYMVHIQRAAERKMRAALLRLPDGRREFVDHLDDGARIAVAVTIAGERATIDFTGTDPVLPGNLNANRSIVTAAVMYCLRLLIDEEIPLNEGVLAPVTLILPECLLNPPRRARPEDCAAVVGGNVETSQRVVDVLLGALELAAASQGTMNNFLFGDATFGYYETIGGGSGATASADGADAVHTHMTNTRLTDPEVIERRYPVRLHEFAIRRGSGGKGRRRGGDGIVRVVEFLRNLRVSLLTQRRGPYAPYGMQGGMPGAFGSNTWLPIQGAAVSLRNAAQFDAAPGDRLRIETPGGGGWGSASDVRLYAPNWNTPIQVGD